MMQPAEQVKTYDLEHWETWDQSGQSDAVKMSEIVNLGGEDELVYLQRLVDDLKVKLDEAKEASKKDRQRANRMEMASFISAEDWKLELEAMQKQYQKEIFRLQKENEDLKHEIVGANEAKEAALRMARDAMLTGENATKQTELLSVELEKAMAATVASRQEALACMQVLEEIAKQRVDLSEAFVACQKSCQEGAVIVAEKEAELKKQMTALFQAKQEGELLRWELFESRKSETKLCEMTNELEALKMQFACAKQTEEKQAKVVMDMDIELRQAQYEVEQALTTKAELAGLLLSGQMELEDSRQKTVRANAEVVAMTASVESIKDEFETELCQMRTLQRQSTELEAKHLEALKKLAESLSREETKDEALTSLECSLETSKVELQLLQQQVYGAVFDAQFSEMETTMELMSLYLILSTAEFSSFKTPCLTGPCLEREIGVLARFLPDTGTHNVKRDSDEALDVNALPVSLESALAACKCAARAISFRLKAVRTQLDGGDKEAAIVVKSTNDSDFSGQGVQQPSQEKSTQQHPVMEEALKASGTSHQFQEDCHQQNLLDVKVDIQGKCRDLSEPWEMINSGSEATVTIKKEEYDSLRVSVHEAMELQSLNESQVLSLRVSNQRLLAQLEARNMEMKALRLSEQSMFEQYDRLQQQNVLLEAEIRSLKARDELISKSWEVDANAIQCSRSIRLDKQHLICRDLSSSEKEEEESSEFISLSSKKKKKALYLRLGTFLVKK